MFDIYLSMASSAALKAGEFLLSSKDKVNIIKTELGRDIKLLADEEAERLIRYELNNSNIPVLGEELGLDISSNEFLWVVDPLDGTANYNRDIPISCVSIALLENKNPILGVIYDFNNNHLYKGGIYADATINNKKIKVSSITDLSRATLMTGLPVNTDYSSKSMQSLIYDFKNWKKVRMIGSAAIASIYVASGKADFYKEIGTNIWDVAAGVAIARSAGGNADIKNMNERFSLDIAISNGKLEF